MIQKQAIEAYRVLVKMGGMALPIPTAYKLYQMRKMLEPIYEFRIEQEKPIIERCHGVWRDGTLSFASQEDFEQAQKALDELDLMELEEPITAVALKMEDVSNTALTMDDLACLDGFIIFE